MSLFQPAGGDASEDNSDRVDAMAAPAIVFFVLFVCFFMIFFHHVRVRVAQVPSLFLTSSSID